MVLSEGSDIMAATDSAGNCVIADVLVGMNRVVVSRNGCLGAYTVERFVKDWAVSVNLYLSGSAFKPDSRK